MFAAIHRVEQIVAAQEVFLTQFNAIVRDRHVVVSGVVAALAVLLAQTPPQVLSLPITPSALELFRARDFLTLSLVCPRVRLAKLSSEANAAVLAPKTVKARSSFLKPVIGDFLMRRCFLGTGKVTHPALNSP